jgi:ribosomal protein S7
MILKVYKIEKHLDQNMVLKKLKKTLFLKDSFENNIMINGLKSLAEKQFLKSMMLLQRSSLKNYKLIILLALINNMPILYLKKLKKKKKKNNNNIYTIYISNSKNSK